MPQMVMAHLPRGVASSRRRARANKPDNIMEINYLYVGKPKYKYTFYVRERLYYRSNVEVSYNDVYDFLTEACADSSITLHYCVSSSRQYVSITTTGQLHTFLEHLKQDPKMLLYIESKDYVWNLRPKSRKRKEKANNSECQCKILETGQNCVCNPDETDDESCEDEDEEEYESDYSCEVEAANPEDRRDESVEEEDDEDDEEEYEDEDEEEDDEEDDDDEDLKISDTPEKYLNEDDEYEMETLAEITVGLFLEVDSKNESTESCNSAGLLAEDGNSSGQVESEHEAEVPTPKDSLKIVLNNVNEDDIFVYVKKVVDRFDLLRYEGKTLERLCTDISTTVVSAYWPDEYPKQMLAYRNTVRYLIFVVGTRLFDQYQKSKAQSPTLGLTDKLLKKMVKALCSDAVEVATSYLKLEKMKIRIKVLANLNTMAQSMYRMSETRPKLEAVEKLLSETIELVSTTFGVLTTGKIEKCPCVLKIGNYLTEMDSMLKFVQKNGKMGELSDDDWINLLNNLDTTSRKFIAVKCQRHLEYTSILVEADFEKTVPRVIFGNNHAAADHKKVKWMDEKQTEIAKRKIAMAVATGTPATSAKSAPNDEERKKEISNELKGKIKEMMKIAPHNYVYPPPPKPGAILIPTGGLAHCRCRKDCQFLLNEPAYEYIERFNEQKTTLLEKTKQKRFKKN